MKPKYICDNCEEKLKDKMEDDDTIWVISDNIDHFSMMEHHNCKKHIVLCDGCEEEARQELIENEDWISLQEWDTGDVKDFYDDFPKLKAHIDKLNEKESKEDKHEETR